MFPDNQHVRRRQNRSRIWWWCGGGGGGGGGSGDRGEEEGEEEEGLPLREVGAVLRSASSSLDLSPSAINCQQHCEANCSRTLGRISTFLLL